MGDSCRRVVITGLGVIAPNGIGKDSFWHCKVAAEVKDFKPEQFMNVRRTKHRGRFSQFAVAAAKLALEDARVVLADEPSERVMLCLGTSAHGIADVYETGVTGFQDNGVAGIPLTTGIEYAAHAASGHVSVEIGIKGQAMTLASACSTGLDVAQWAAAQISEDRASVVLAGCSEAPFGPMCFAAFCASGSLSAYDRPPTRASRPYDLDEIDYINSHGNALPDYDLVETLAFKRAFGSIAYNIPISSIKSMIGHALGAASAFQLAAACLSLRDQVIPPTINLDTPDPACDLDYVPFRAREARLRNALINAHAMGGTHSVLVLAHRSPS